MSVTMPVQSHPYNGRISEVGISAADRNFAVAMHLTPLANLIGFFPFAFFVPLVLWLVRKDESAFADDHGREILNFTISFCLWHLILLVTFIGVVLWPVLWIVAMVSVIRASIAGSRGEYFRYPMNFRFL